jgi:hypothetical protein
VSEKSFGKTVKSSEKVNGKLYGRENDSHLPSFFFFFGQNQKGTALSFAIAHRLSSTVHSNFIQFCDPFLY